ncbi:MAG: hypothetical protein O2924_02520 [Chloroflexi bacterium]|nr:hypothetical protein [Chloroflexota bacterium]MQC16914.1 hypothetical protein [Chloroflexota bacterium]
MTVWVGRYAVVSGQVREHGPWLVDRARRREDEELRVVVLVEPVDQRSTEFCNEVAEAVAALFARESLSLTGGLLRALRQAHANLAEWNRRSLREHHVAVGVTCAVVRDNDEVLVAQAGPGVAYTRQGDIVRRLSTEGLSAAIPLGGSEPIEPLFTSFSLVDGQLLLLTENAERATGPHTIEAALRAGPERTLAEIFPHTRALSDMTAVLIADLDIDEQQAAPPLDFGVEDPAEVEGREVAFSGGDPPAPPRVRRPRNWRVLGGDRSPPMPELRRTRVVGARNSLPTLVPWRTAGIVMAVAIALALAAWLALPGLLSEDRAAELTAAIAAAEAQLEIASSVGTPEQQRAALQSTLIEVERARALAPDDPRIPRIVADAEARLQALDAITVVEALGGVLAFEGSVTAPVEPQDLEAGGGRLWLQESGQGRIVQVDPEGVAEPVEVYRGGESYGEAQALEPVAIAWDASTSRLLVLDAARTLFAVSLDGNVERLDLRDAAELRSATAIAVYLGNLYLLDPVGGQVWRYLPAANGFDSERSGILGTVELSDTTALAVDGQVFILDPPGLRRFVQGREQEPMFQGIDQPPAAAVGLVEDVLREILYVADRGGERIIASDREGTFLRQYRHPDFIDLRGLAVAPDGTAIYALTGSGISRFAITPR